MPAAEAPARCYLLWGKEELRKKQALTELLDRLVPPEDRDLDVQWIDATNSGVTGDAIISAVRDRAMFSERRVVVVTHAGRLRGPKHQRTQEDLASGIATLPDYSTLILVAYAESGEERSGARAPFDEKLMAAIRKHGKVMAFAHLKPEEMARLAVDEAERLGKKLPPQAAQELVKRNGTDSQQLLQEVRKLALYIGDARAISAADISVMLPPTLDETVWNYLDAVVNGEAAKALSVLRQLERGGSSPFAITPLLARTLRQLLQVKALQARGIRADDEPERFTEEVRAMLPEDSSLYQSKAWARQKLWRQASRLSWRQLQLAHDRLAVMEAGTKGWEHGIEDPELALEVLTAQLAARA